MTLLDLLYALKAFCEEATKKLKLPEAVQKGDTKAVERAPKGYIQRLPDEKAPQKFAPYFIVQAAVGHHVQKEGEEPENTADVRIICCTYNENAEEGAISLLNLMETIKYKLLRAVKIDDRFLLDVHSPLESFPYPEYTGDYYAGEINGVFILPPIRRDVTIINGKKDNFLGI